MSDAVILLITGCISLGGVIVSMLSATFIAGSRWGSVNTRLTTVENDLKEIKGMFRLTLKDPN